MKKAKIEVECHTSGIYRVTKLVNMASFTNPQGIIYTIRSDILPRDMDSIARDRRWDCTIVPAK